MPRPWFPRPWHTLGATRAHRQMGVHVAVGPRGCKVFRERVEGIDAGAEFERLAPVISRIAGVSSQMTERPNPARSPSNSPCATPGRCATRRPRPTSAPSGRMGTPRISRVWGWAIRTTPSGNLLDVERGGRRRSPARRYARRSISQGGCSAIGPRSPARVRVPMRTGSRRVRKRGRCRTFGCLRSFNLWP